MSQSTDTRISAAAATANWWADQVFGGTVASNGDGLATMLSFVAGAQGRLPEPGKREKFVARLTAHAEQFLAYAAKRGRRPLGLILSTDYGPEGALATIGDEFGIGGSFPWKTRTRTHSTHVTAALGYGAPFRLIWQDEAWERPLCHQGKWGERNPEPWKCSELMYHEGAHVFDIPEPLCQAPHPHFDDERCLHAEGDSLHSRDGEYAEYEYRHDFEPA